MEYTLYSYYVELRGRKVALVRSFAPIESPEKLFSMVVNDSENFKRVYELLTPPDVTEVILTGDTFDFLMCGDLDFFTEWLRIEILKGNYHCVKSHGESPF